MLYHPIVLVFCQCFMAWIYNQGNGKNGSGNGNGNEEG
jgi:hypothetical protein